MKSILFLLVFALFLSISGKAQTQQGSVMIGGNGSFTHENGIGLTLLPNLGYFVADNLALGTNMEFRYSDTDFNKSWTAGVQPFARYYFGEEAQTRFFGQLSGGISRTKEFVLYYDPNVPIYDAEIVFKNNFYGAGVGVTHFLTETVGLEIQAVYHSTQMGITARRNRFGLLFGVQVYLPGNSSQ